MGEETSVRSPPKNIFRTSQSCEAVSNSSLRPEEVENWSWGRPFSLFQDVLCEKANECELLNRKTIFTLGQVAIPHLNNRFWKYYPECYWIRMLCGQPVFLILKSRKSYFRCNSVLSSDYYRYEIFDFQAMINPILEIAIQMRTLKLEIRIWFPKCHL